MQLAIPIALFNASLTAQTTYNVAKHCLDARAPRQVDRLQLDGQALRKGAPLHHCLQAPLRPQPKPPETSFAPSGIAFWAMAGVILLGAHLTCGMSLTFMAFQIGTTVGVMYACHEAANFRKESLAWAK